MWEKLLGVLLSAGLNTLIVALENWQSAKVAEANKWNAAAQQVQMQSTADAQAVQFNVGQAVNALPTSVKTSQDLSVLFGRK